MTHIIYTQWHFLQVRKVGEGSTKNLENLTPYSKESEKKESQLLMSQNEYLSVTENRRVGQQWGDELNLQLVLKSTLIECLSRSRYILYKQHFTKELQAKDTTVAKHSQCFSTPISLNEEMLSYRIVVVPNYISTFPQDSRNSS